MAFTFHDRVDIAPISYVYGGDDWIYGRTSPGAKLLTMQHHPWIAFEVDSARGPFDWDSVVVHGTFHAFSAVGTGKTAAYLRALEAVRSIAPDTLTGNDPVPHRNVIFGIEIVSVTGRSCRLVASE